MSKYEWMIKKCQELNNNLFFNTFTGNDQILSQIENNNCEVLFNKILDCFEINLIKYNFKVSHRITNKGYYQNWHLDGKRVFENRKGIICPTNPTNNEKYVLHNIFDPTPIYSILYYGSTYDQDFKGGLIEFINGIKIKPYKNLCIIFDSNLGHQVTLQTDGQRSCYLIMVYQ